MRIPIPNRAIQILLTATAIAVAIIVMAMNRNTNVYIPPPPPAVTVSHPLKQPVTAYLDVTGTVKSVAVVDLAARVEGFLQSISFTDGSFVNKGDPLFVIEPAPYEAKVKLSEAAVRQDQALLDRANTEYQRQVRLVKQNASSQAELERWQAQRDAAAAALDEARANLDIAKINFGYTHIVAPFDGRIGRHSVDIGNLVGAGAATKLATIEQLDPIYVYFNVSEQDVLRIRESRRQRGETASDLSQMPVFVGLPNEESYPHEGKLNFIATGISTSTGTLEARALMPNADHTLLPGSFVRVRVPTSPAEESLVISERAIGIDQAGPYVLVITKDNVVEQRRVETGAEVDGMRVIRSGVTTADWVVVDGIQRALPGSKVAPTAAPEEPAARPQASSAPQDPR